MVKTLGQCNIVYATGGTLSFKEGTGNEGDNLKMDMVTSLASLLSEYPRFGQHGLMLDVKIIIPFAPSVLNAFVEVVGSALAEGHLVDALPQYGKLSHVCKW